MTEDGTIRFDGRTVLITGAGRGIGAAQARLMAVRGARVMVADTGSTLDGLQGDTRLAEMIAGEIRGAGGDAIACVEHIATEDGAARAVEATLDAFGRIDAICHYASTSPDLTEADRISSADLDLLMRINPMACLWLARAAWPRMTAQRFGRIVLTTSGGIYGSFGNAPYAAAKAAVIGAMRCLAIEGQQHGILVNAVAPAAWTRMTDRFQDSEYARWFSATMTPERVAPAVAFLMSEECSVNGQAFAIGGGRIGRMTIAETGGMFGIETIEQARAAWPSVMADENWLYPDDLAERSAAVTRLYGKELKLEASKGIAIQPITRE